MKIRYFNPPLSRVLIAWLNYYVENNLLECEILLFMENKNGTSKSNGYKVVNFCEFDKYAAKSYCAIHDIDERLNLGDITKVDETKLEPFNMICGGSPCFPKGTMVNTKTGLKDIADVKVGDYVYTHNNRYMKVDRIGGEKNKDIYQIKAQGMLDIYATSYHPFYVKKQKTSKAEKVYLSDLKKGYYLASPINTTTNDDEYLTDELCWILGRYVADGHIRYSKRKGKENSYQYGVVLSIEDKKVDNVKNHITSYHYSCYPHSQSVHRICISSKELTEYIMLNNFGDNALIKQIPQKILNLPVDKLKIFLEGYMSGDGCRIKDTTLYSATTISKQLALNLCEAIQKVYRVGCRVYYTPTKDTSVIDGRLVNQNDTYIVRYDLDSTKNHHWFIEENKVWYPIRKITKTDRMTDVYNIEVNTDHTYIADGIIAYNCQDFSIAGKQAGSTWKCKDCGCEYNPLIVHYSKRNQCPNCESENLDKTRSSLLVEWLRVIRANRPRWGIYENVKNIVGKQFRETFQMFIDELHEYGYNTYFKVLNAKDYGIPQNRERVYLIIILKEFDNGKFKFPEPFDDGTRLKDVLEDEVDDKYYINTPKSQKLINDLILSGKLNRELSNTVRAGGGEEV